MVLLQRVDKLGLGHHVGLGPSGLMAQFRLTVKLSERLMRKCHVFRFAYLDKMIQTTISLGYENLSSILTS